MEALDAVGTAEAVEREQERLRSNVTGAASVIGFLPGSAYAVAGAATAGAVSTAPRLDGGQNTRGSLKKWR